MKEKGSNQNKAVPIKYPSTNSNNSDVFFLTFTNLKEIGDHLKALLYSCKSD